MELNAIGLDYQLGDFFSPVEVVDADNQHAFSLCRTEETLLYLRCDDFGAKSFTRRHASRDSRDGVKKRRDACIAAPAHQHEHLRANVRFSVRRQHHVMA